MRPATLKQLRLELTNRSVRTHECACAHVRAQIAHSSAFGKKFCASKPYVRYRTCSVRRTCDVRSHFYPCSVLEYIAQYVAVRRTDRTHAHTEPHCGDTGIQPIGGILSCVMMDKGQSEQSTIPSPSKTDLGGISESYPVLWRRPRRTSPAF